MFQNSYQNGTFFELYDPKVSQDKIKTLFRMTNAQVNNKVFDKDLKTYVLEFLTPGAKICFPKEQKKDLYLIQQYLILQIFFFPGMSWNLELVVSDLNKTKRRIILSPATNKNEVKPFFVKSPCCGFKEGVWNNFSVDLFSYMQAFKGQTYRSLDGIYITGHFKLRRIYTTNTQPLENEGENQSQEIQMVNFLPKNFYFPLGVLYSTNINKYQGENYQENYQPTEPSTKNNSHLNKVSKSKLLPSKVETIAKTEKTLKQQPENKKYKEFLSNTNGTSALNRNRKEEKYDSDTSQGNTNDQSRTAKSTEKYGKKQKLTKTQQMPGKLRSSLDKNSSKINNEEKMKVKAKLNPWRTNQKGGFTDASQLQISKHEDERNIESAHSISMFKTKNNLISKFNESKNNKFEGKSDQYSDSQYVELSQKFSTLTDGKFFKNQPSNKQLPLEHKNEFDQDEIQENIEMESNSIYSASNKKEEVRAEQIIESISDSLDKSPEKKRFDELGRHSYYGFGQKLMSKFMGDYERPYSPPLGEREMTEEDMEKNYNEEKEEVQLIYDPVLNCYYDHKTHTYYELKN